MKKQFNWSTRSENNRLWTVFYDCPGQGFDRGRKVYYGRSQFSSEATAVADQQDWENRFAEVAA